MSRPRFRDVLLAFVITVLVAVPVTGLTVWLTTPITPPAAAAATTPPDIRQALRPVEVRTDGGTVKTIPYGATVTVLATGTAVGPDGTTAVVLYVNAGGVRGNAYAIDPNDGRPVFGPVK